MLHEKEYNEKRIRLCFVQFGDFRDAYCRFKNGLEETYGAQKYSVSYVTELASKVDAVLTICVNSVEKYNEEIDDGLYAAGLKLYRKEGTDLRNLINIVRNFRPTHIIARTPILGLLKWGALNKVKQFPILADSFLPTGSLIKIFRSYIINIALRRIFNSTDIDFVGNHNIAACRDLARIGIKKNKIVPWDWPRYRTPNQFPAKDISNIISLNVLYVGSVTEQKGVGDLIEGVAALKQSGNKIYLTIIGHGELRKFEDISNEKGLDGRVDFKGRVSQTEVYECMRRSDVVVVPSHHSYPEGMPLTIYEALTTRTPVIISDHPMFLGYLKDGDGVIIVPERSPQAIATALVELKSNPKKYRSLSEATMIGFSKIVYPVLWHELIDHWLTGGCEGHGWLKNHSLEAVD